MSNIQARAPTEAVIPKYVQPKTILSLDVPSDLNKNYCNKCNPNSSSDTGPNRKVSYEKATSGFTLKLGGGGAEVKKEKEAFVSNVAVTDDTPSFLEMIQEQDTSAR